MLLQTYVYRTNEVPNEDIMQCLSQLEKKNLSEEFTRLVIRGKIGQKVLVLTDKMTESLDFLLDKRGVDNCILDSNVYVFARLNSDSQLRLDCLRKYAVASEAKRPETLTSTHLRKHVAT